jgi:nitroimidazol reductase NimA-like FMN-containing flavoprotein (pyridoxamine 5'-phosphate oxidase superfamily)
MRHPKREIHRMSTIATLLERSQVGRIATVNRNGFPVIKPVNYLYRDGKVYVHSSFKGEKIRDLRRGSPVCFEVDQPIVYLTASKETACKASTCYRSVIIQGRAVLVKHPALKKGILEALMEKYQPEGGYGGISNRILEKTAVIEVSVGKVTGKEYFG